jgi:A nuclease of the HNH/ENDO VII superfamily with conserved WHH
VSDYSLVPVDHQPDFENVSLVPVEHDPFIEEGEAQQAQSQQALTQPVQPPDQPPQQPAAGVARLYVGPPANNTQASEVGESWSPDAEDSDTSGPSRSAASTPAQGKPVYDSSQFNQPFGELKPWTPTPTQRIGYLAADGLMALGMKPYAANDWATRLGNLLGLTPLGVLGSALDLIDAKRRDDFPEVLTAALGMIPGARGIARGAAGEAGAGLRALLRRSPSSRAAEKGYPGIRSTPNGGPTFAATEHLYPAGEGQQSVVKIPLTGSRRDDYKLAHAAGGFPEKPKGYMWHHVDDFDPQTGMSSLELIRQEAHLATQPHVGSVGQWERFHGRKYKR